MRNCCLFIVLSCAGHAALCAEQRATPATLQRWIADLRSDDFSARDNAMRALAGGGSDAIALLRQAAVDDDPEVRWRASQAMADLYAASDDEQTDSDAHAALTALSQQADSSAARIARAALNNQPLAKMARAVAELKRLNAEVAIEPGQNQPQYVILDEAWRGHAKDLKHLSRLNRLELLCIWSVPIDAEGLAALMQVRSVGEIRLYDTGLDEKTAEKVAAATGAHVDWRRGAFLGLQSGNVAQERAPITTVQAGSPAEKCDIRAGDVLIEFGGQEVKDFQGFLKQMVQKAPGEKAVLVLQRGTPIKTVTVEATFGKWSRANLLK